MARPKFDERFAVRPPESYGRPRDCRERTARIAKDLRTWAEAGALTARGCGSTLPRMVSAPMVSRAITAATVRASLAARADAKRAARLARFFRTGPGEYGEGDRFIGVTVPLQREVARTFAALPIIECRALLSSPVHEHRLTAALVLVHQFQIGDEACRRRIYRVLLATRRALDNWDLVDTAAPRIFGAYLLAHPEERRRFDRLLRSRRLWDRRIAVLTAGALIPAGRPELLLEYAGLCLDDPHDLMHKAVGWMLREVGKRDLGSLRRFLDRHAGEMPRTMLRYAIERLPATLRKRYLAKS
jgi:3-methyladenine DNA glycosylase AlkD